MVACLRIGRERKRFFACQCRRIHDAQQKAAQHGVVGGRVALGRTLGDRLELNPEAFGLDRVVEREFVNPRSNFLPELYSTEQHFDHALGAIRFVPGGFALGRRLLGFPFEKVGNRGVGFLLVWGLQRCLVDAAQPHLQIGAIEPQHVETGPADRGVSLAACTMRTRAFSEGLGCGTTFCGAGWTGNTFRDRRRCGADYRLKCHDSPPEYCCVEH